MGPDICRIVSDFFAGNTLPKSIINLVFVLKKSLVQNFSELRPISLSNFAKEIFSKIVHD